MEGELKVHWNNKYASTETEKLGWFELVSQTSLSLIRECDVGLDAHIFIAGAGSSRLLVDLVALSYKNITACDISSVALDSTKSRLGEKEGEVYWIIDDLTNPSQLDAIPEVYFWHDRAVLHFFVEALQRKSYFELIRKKVAAGGYVMLAAYSEREKATQCSNLPVRKYNRQLFIKELGDQFKEVKSFHETHRMPGGHTRDYIYGLFKKVDD